MRESTLDCIRSPGVASSKWGVRPVVIAELLCCVSVEAIGRGGKKVGSKRSQQSVPISIRQRPLQLNGTAEGTSTNLVPSLVPDVHD